MIVEGTGLKQGYGRMIAVSDVDLRIERGRLGLLGPNGAGKTTLLRTLATVVPPRDGQLCIDGHQVRTAADARRARRLIGWLPQHFGYFPAFTVRDFVAYSAWLRELPRAEIEAATDSAIATAGLAGLRGTKLRKLSGGMLRRCGIASAIVGQPRLVLLDEPTVGLDPEQRLEFRELLRSLDGVGVVLSTHLVEDVAAVCDQVVVLHEGRVAFSGTMVELTAAGSTRARGDNDLERGYTTVLADRIGKP